jgi:hypothetical protein
VALRPSSIPREEMSAAADLLERIRRALPPPSLFPLTPLSSRALSFFSLRAADEP